MQRSIHDRLAQLEDAVLRTDGALYALHDLIAHSRASAPENEVRRTISKLKLEADNLDAALGPERIAGYRDELASIEQEIEYLRIEPPGVFARFRRA